MTLKSSLLAFTAVLAFAAPAFAADKSGDGEPAFRELYKELVETNTTLSAGSCTLAAERMAARLKAVGYSDDDIHLFSTPEHPKEGGLVAVFHGTGSKKKPILLLAHIDVVEANRADWTRDPFTLVEEGGYFYARGASDDKAMAAVFTDLMVRFKQEGYKPKRDIKLALTCGEETSGAFNGAEWLGQNHKDWIDAAYAINEGGSGQLDENGKMTAFGVQAAEKVFQNYQIETTNPGGHSSQPVPQNAIYDMAADLTKLSALEFPVEFNETTRAYFTKMADITGGETGAAMKALLKDPNDAAANAIVSKDKKWHSMLRTTCVATMIQGGHATNALPQRVDTNINCRILPGTSVESVRQVLDQAIGDPNHHVTILEPRSPATPSPALDPEIMAAVDAVSSKLFPGVPVLPTMTTGATDGIYTTAAGIPTYGISGMFVDPDGGGVHGLNERIRVKSLMDGRKFQYQFVKKLADL
ncbi:MAG: M20/M25/M40 family metallo-hydrolase [Asticcacaulis sp.]|uniref:M20/M25/M40 family metallo-hydrolase n=1 Tax=Asticcacaulis sp. TaxID=1872648 RepID=UPI0039E51D7B